MNAENLAFAPILVPLLRICLERTNSLSTSFSCLYSFIIRKAKALLFLSMIDTINSFYFSVFIALVLSVFRFPLSPFRIKSINSAVNRAVYWNFIKAVNYSPLIAATPGRTLPSIASRRAPPPVEMYDTWSAIPNLLIQATESPPPMSENAPLAVALPIASAIAREPAVKLSNSNTPAGPFQRIVFASTIAAAKAF